VGEARDSKPAAEGFAAVVKHLAWRAAPTAGIDVDADGDTIIVSFFLGLPQIEIDPSPRLSVGFHLGADEYLLTSLCLSPIVTWSSSGSPEGRTARALLGPTITGVIDEMITEVDGDAAERTVLLSLPEAGRLAADWQAYVRRETRAVD
jgi:hypothetical protein